MVSSAQAAVSAKSKGGQRRSFTTEQEEDMFPKKIRILSIALGIISTVVVATMLWLVLEENTALSSVPLIVLTAITAIVVGLVNSFLMSGMVTEAEVRIAIKGSREFLSRTQVANTIDTIRGIGDIDEFHRADPSYVGFVLRKLANRRLIEKTVTRSVGEDGREINNFAYRPWQPAPGYGVDRITGHLRNAHPSA